MRRPRSITLFGLAAPLLLMQTTPSGCLSDGTGGGGSPLFNLPPTAVLTSDVQRGVAPLKVYFSSSGSSDDGVIVRREWDFGDGVGTSQEISPTYTFQSNGIFTVRLTLTDDRGATSSTTIVISVTERPIAIIAVDRTTAETAPATFEFDGSASFDPDAAEGETLLYRWDFGDGSRELLASVSHTFATAGTYRVRLTVTDAVGVTGSADKIIEVGIPRPTISFRAPPADARGRRGQARRGRGDLDALPPGQSAQAGRRQAARPEDDGVGPQRAFDALQRFTHGRGLERSHAGIQG